MSYLLQLALFCLVLTVISCDSVRGHGRSSTGSAKEGDPCNPSRPRTCGGFKAVDETVTVVEEREGQVGPNVCKTERVYETQTFSYSYSNRKRCPWYFCPSRLVCKSTGNCEGDVVNKTRTRYDCCEGFARDPSVSSYSLRRSGCPLMVRDSVRDCLEDLNLSASLSTLDDMPELLAQLVTDTSSSYTIFAPSEGDFGLGHIVNRTKPIFVSSLGSGQRLTPIDDRYTLHVSTIYSRSDRAVYLNGVRVSNQSCAAKNGIVYVVDSVIPLSDQTIAQVLSDSPDRFSTFYNLLNVTGIEKLLDQNGKSRTLLAPTNEALEMLPLECLLQDSNKHRRVRGKLVTLHISSPAEYSSTLSQRSYLQSFAGKRLSVRAEDGLVNVTNKMITIEEFDIPASNGVIHVLPEPILVGIDLEKLCLPEDS